MAITLAPGLQALGVPTRLAVEIQRQIAAGVGNLLRLRELSMPVKAAEYLAAGISATSVNAVKLSQYSVVPDVAVLISKSVNAPFNTVRPTITGTAQVGQTLTSTTGTWRGTGLTYTRRWTANNVTIPGATGVTYVPVVGQIGQVIRVVVEATSTATPVKADATSNPTAAVIAA